MYCLNGGSCLYPFINCACPSGWEGNRCETGISFYTLCGIVFDVVIEWYIEYGKIIRIFRFLEQFHSGKGL